MHNLFTKPRLWKTCEQRKSARQIKRFPFRELELFTAFQVKNACGEQVLFVTFRKNPARQENFGGADFA